jgi:hypothetical protein
MYRIEIKYYTPSFSSSHLRLLSLNLPMHPSLTPSHPLHHTVLSHLYLNSSVNFSSRSSLLLFSILLLLLLFYLVHLLSSPFSLPSIPHTHFLLSFTLSSALSPLISLFLNFFLSYSLYFFYDFLLFLFLSLFSFL